MSNERGEGETFSEPTNVFLFPNGTTAVTDADGHQIIGLQEPWIFHVIANLVAKGHDPTKLSFTLPSGRKARVFEIGGGKYNWRFE